jgi:polyhydroxyalkanoate synthesis repressor PhaR
MSDEKNTDQNESGQESEDIRIIKKYPNRRIYDTHTSQYIKVDDIRQLIVDGTNFVILDSKSGEDVTRSVLLQLIIEQESENNPLFTTDNLKSFIRYYGQGPHQPFAEFMNQSLSFFQYQQEQINESFQGMMGANPIKDFSDIYKQNMKLWEKMSENFFSSGKK